MDPRLPSPRPILVVDDDAKIVRLVRTYLERDGFTVLTAADGRRALEAIEREAPALVVLDLMLPEIDGRAVIRAIRQHARSASIPILVLSARGSTIERIAGLEDGADDYLAKPFSPSELVVRSRRSFDEPPHTPSWPTRPPLPPQTPCGTETCASTEGGTRSPRLAGRWT
jgi:DNA-binding response OmpR family regulator